MYEQLSSLLVQILYHAVNIIGNKLIPQVGVGGSVEVLKEVPMDIVVYGLIVLGGLGIVFGVALAIVAARFVVRWIRKWSRCARRCRARTAAPADLRAAWAMLKRSWEIPMWPSSMCAPGKSAVAEKIAVITGKKAEKVDPKIARVFCQGGTSLSQRKFIYTGVKDCTAAVLGRGRRQILRVRLPRTTAPACGPVLLMPSR